MKLSAYIYLKNGTREERTVHTCGQVDEMTVPSNYWVVFLSDSVGHTTIYADFKGFIDGWPYYVESDKPEELGDIPF